MSVRELKSLNKNKKMVFGGKKNKPLKNAYIESYGCQMNFSDSEVVASILTKDGYSISKNIEKMTL